MGTVIKIIGLRFTNEKQTKKKRWLVTQQTHVTHMPTCS